MTKNIMSIAAAAAILTSGAFAFETVIDDSYVPQGGNTIKGATPLLNINKARGAYKSDYVLTAPKNVRATQDLMGDALIYPAFKAEDGWSTEITVRNNENYAVVAKLVAYSAIDSQELRDFNIYLSPQDVFRCTIKDGKITTTDDSVNIGNGWGVFENVTIPEDTGYVAVYAMLTADGNGDNTKSIYWHTPKAAALDLKDPKVVLKDAYMQALNGERPGWQTLPMEHGVYTLNHDNDVMNAPKLDTQMITVKDIKVSPDGLTAMNIKLTEPGNDALSGSVRISNADEPRDLVMPATAVEDYTDGFVMLWAPNELAAWSDRNIIADGKTKLASDFDGYSNAGVLLDARRNTIDVAYYTYNNATVDASESQDLQNKLLITQPTKRTLVQQGQGNFFWRQFKDVCKLDGATSGAEAWPMVATRVDQPLANGSLWGLVYAADIWDEAENKNSLDTPPELSPGDSSEAGIVCKEVAEIANLEMGTELEEKNGYAIVQFIDEGAPAIINQMTASQVGNSREINWVNVSTR